MANINKGELWQELDATDEAFVRQKHAKGGYGSAKGRVVSQWLEMKNAQRKALQDEENLRATRSTAIWTKIGALVATAGVISAIIIAFALKSTS